MTTVPERTSIPTGGIDLAFTTARLRARALGDADEQLFTTLYCDPQVMRFIATPFTPEQASQRFQAVIADHGSTGAVLAVSERSTDRPIGIFAIQRTDWIRHQTEGGLMLLPEYQSCGYATEGFAALVTQVFARLPIDEFRVRIAEANSFAQRLGARIGLTRRTDLEPVEGNPGLQVWSANRQSWSTTTINQ